MVADTSDPKFWMISLGFYVLGMVLLWKVNIVESTVDITWIKVIISVAFLPMCLGIIYAMSED